jgi:outer membrane autotransporter protein
MLYGNWDLTQGVYLDGMAAYGWDNINRTRHNVGGVSGLDANASYNARQFDVQAETGKVLAFHGMSLTPNVLAHWVNWNPQSYTETGAGGADLHVSGKTLNVFELGGGVKVGWDFKQTDGAWLKPQVSIGYRYAVTDDQVEDTSTFTGGGAAFTVNGPTPARSSVDLGASIKYQTTRNWDFLLSYDVDWRDNYLSNAGFLRAVYRF